MPKTLKKPLYKRALPSIGPDQLEGAIYLVRGQRVMLDSDLAPLYGVLTKALNQAVRRNLDRFPEDFMFQLLPEEADILRSHIVTSSSTTMGTTQQKAHKGGGTSKNLKSQIVTSSFEHGGRRNLPLAFTEQGVSMLSSVLRSARAAKVNIGIIRTFVRLRQFFASHSELELRPSELENRYDRKFKAVFDTIRELMDRSDPVKPEDGREIGFHSASQMKEEHRPYRCFTARTDAHS